MNYRLWVTPQTHVRATQNDKYLFRIPEEKLTPPQLKRKRRLEKYNAYKEKLIDEALDRQFAIPEDGFDITFCIPVPAGRHWKLSKKAEMDHRPHQFKPDIDNLLKAFMDALKKKDQRIWQINGMRKVWINQTYGYIDIDIPDMLF